MLFSHVSNFSICKLSLSKKKVVSKLHLWFTHPGPKFGIKKLILYLSFLISEQMLLQRQILHFHLKVKKYQCNWSCYRFEKFNKSKTQYSI